MERIREMKRLGYLWQQITSSPLQRLSFTENSTPNKYTHCLRVVVLFFGMLPVDSTLQWRHNGRDSVSNHQPHDCLLNRLFRCRSKKTSKLRVTCLCAGNSPGTGEFPAQMASYAENVSIWWRHHELLIFFRLTLETQLIYLITV